MSSLANAKHGKLLNELTSRKSRKSRKSNKTVINEIEDNGQKSENQTGVAEILNFDNSFFYRNCTKPLIAEM